MRSKKGFTLAELLIVVAIIAVLVAIAVPLFVSGLKKAEEARDNANVRSVKSAAEVILLEAAGDTTSTYWKDQDDATEGVQLAGWTITATIEKDGSITIETGGIAPLKDAAAVAKAKETEKTEWQADGTCDIITVLTPTELSK